MNRAEFFDQAFLVFLGKTSDAQAAAVRAAEALEHRDAAHALLFPPVPPEPRSSELGSGFVPSDLLEEI